MQAMQSVKSTKIFLWVIVLCALIGLVNAAVVFEKAQSGGVVPCFVVSGCDQVQNSSYAHLFGVPLSLWGIGYYLVLMSFTVGIMRLISSEKIHRLMLHGWVLYVGFGFLFSLYLLYLQIFPIGALCSSCLLSLADMMVGAASAVIVWKRMRQNTNSSQ